MTCGKKTKHTTRIGCCPLCRELFSSDSAFAKHRGTGTACTPPEEAGLVARPSRTAEGEVIWGYPSRESNPWTTKEEAA